MGVNRFWSREQIAEEFPAPYCIIPPSAGRLISFSAFLRVFLRNCLTAIRGGSVNIESQQNKATTRSVIALFWRGARDQNPNTRFWQDFLLLSCACSCVIA
jgi:hypothetical protein